MFVGLQPRLETDPSPRERARMHRSCQNGLRSLVEWSVTDETVATLFRKIEGGIGHWLTDEGEPVALRKIIGTLRTNRGMFVHETLLSLLALWRQQGRNPYEELRRVVNNNEMISRAHAMPAVETSG